MEVIFYNSRILTTQKPKNFLPMIENSVLLLSFFPCMNLLSLVLNSQSLFLLIQILFFFSLLAKEITPRHYKSRMLLRKFSNLQIIHAAGTNLIVADMLNIKATSSHTLFSIFFQSVPSFLKQVYKKLE